MTSEKRRVSKITTLLVLIGATLALAVAAPAKKETADLIVIHARLVTMDSQFSVYDSGGLAVSRGKIVAVGSSSEIEGRFAARSRFDARGSIVMPGLVNTHTHAAMNLLRGIADDVPLDRWLQEDIFPAEAKNVSPEFVYDGTLAASLEMIEGGTTTFADMYYFESEAARAVERAGLRAVMGETFIDFPVPDHKDLAAALSYTAAFASRWKGHPRIVAAVAPHAPYTCSQETLLAARDLALKEKMPLLIHVAETKKEIDDARKSWQQSPFLRLASIGFFDAGADGGRVPIVAAHAVWIDSKDRELIRQYGVGLSHNPESNMKLASGIADVTAWQREGITWGLGHRRRRRFQQRPLDVRGDGLRRKARESVSTGSDRAARSRSRGRGNAWGRKDAGSRRENRLSRDREAGRPHRARRRDGAHAAVRGPVFRDRLLDQGIGRHRRLGGWRSAPGREEADAARSEAGARRGAALEREGPRVARRKRESGSMIGERSRFPDSRGLR